MVGLRLCTLLSWFRRSYSAECRPALWLLVSCHHVVVICFGVFFLFSNSHFTAVCWRTIFKLRVRLVITYAAYFGGLGFEFGLDWHSSSFYPVFPDIVDYYLKICHYNFRQDPFQFIIYTVNLSYDATLSVQLWIKNQRISLLLVVCHSELSYFTMKVSFL